MIRKIAVIDYGFGNIKSVLNALSACGAEGHVISDPEKIAGFGGAVLPGVGAFGPAADFLTKKGFGNALKDYAARGNMIFGICLGFQLFFTKGYENGEHYGLGLINGEVKKFEFKDLTLKIPHMGWNSVEITDTPGARKMFKGVRPGDDFYFVHSYYAEAEDKSYVSCFCDYGIKFCSSAAHENIWGSQFHPEKSGDEGLKVFSNFINEVNK